MTTLPGPLVSAQWLANHLDSVAVVDVRWYLDGRSGRAAYDAGHIPGAIWVDLDGDLSAPPGPGGRHPLPSPESFAESLGRVGIGDGTVVVAYDDVSGMVAGRLWWMLDSIGEQAAVLDGGIQAWSGELSTQPGTTEPASFSARPWPVTHFVSADEVASRGPHTALIDARSSSRYSGQENTIDPRFGHIPGALSAAWSSNIGDDGHYRSAGELVMHYGELGIGSDSDVIAYCGSGVSACADLLALRLAGNARARLYVGSWSEWGADHARPIEADPGQAGP